MNPIMTLKQYMMKGMTPKGILSQMNIQNPIIGNVVNMAKNGDDTGVENFARNICKQRGIDFDTAFNQFRNNFNK